MTLHTVPSVLSFGGGVNSTALLLGLYERGTPPDLILFADTGGERQQTYDHVDAVSQWCFKRGLPTITRISNADRPDAPHKSLLAECFTNETLPSLAYGNKGCSAKWKRQPMDRYIRGWKPAQEAWAAGLKVERLIGIDAGEAHRSANLEDLDDPKWVYRRPLVYWDWAREECVEAIRRHGLEVPQKSACWFCPAMKKHEVLQLERDHPDLFAIAAGLERLVAPKNGPTVKGLGRAWSWTELVKADKAQLKLFPDAPGEACLCFDGEEEDDA